MTHSPEPATEQELQAKLQEAERGIKSIKHTQEALEREAKDVFDRLHTINVLIKKGRMSGQARENLFDEVHQLRNDPEYLAWSRNYSRLVEFENQQRDAKEALQRLNAVEAPSTPLPEISLDEALKLEPPAPSTATEGDSLELATEQELEAKLQEAERGIRLIRHIQEVLEKQDVFDRLSEINVLLKKGRVFNEEGQNLFDEVHQLRKDPVYVAWRRYDSQLVEFENQQRDAKEALQRLITGEAPPPPSIPEISLEEALKRYAGVSPTSTNSGRWSSFWRLIPWWPESKEPKKKDKTT